jgi:hypothetical protein
METKITHYGKTYEIRSWVIPQNGETIYRIMIDGNESGYFIAKDENGEWDLHHYRTITPMRNIENVESLVEFAQLVSFITYNESVQHFQLDSEGRLN